MEETREMPLLDTRAMVMPDTINEEDRTVEVVWSTGAKGLRGGFFEEPYFEELDMSPQAVRLDRLNNGASVLNTHRQNDLSNVIGAVVRGTAMTNGTEGRAKVQLSRRADVEPYFQDMRDGIITHISVGYRVHQYERIQASKDDKYDTLRATDWEPMELSFVPIAFDDAAKVRSESELHSVRIFTRGADTAAQHNPKEGNDMAEGNATQEDAVQDETRAVETTTPDVDQKRLIEEAQKAERTRIIEIRDAVRKANLDDSLADKLIEDGVSIDTARAAIIDKWAEQGDNTPTRTQRVEMVQDETKVRKDAAVQAILHRANPTEYQLDEAAKDYRGMTLGDMARECLESHGVRTRGMSRMEIASRAMHSTDDYPLILADAVNKTLRKAYDESPRTFVPFTRRASASDFKTIHRVQLGEAPDLEVVPEHGEFKRGTIGEAEETYVLQTYGKIFAITRQTVINDDLDALTRVPMLFGTAAARMQSDVIYDLIINNGAMSDGNNVFSTAHSNVAASGGAIAIATLGAGRAALRTQTGVNGKKINLSARYLVVPAAIETTADQFVSANLTADSAGNINPFSGRLQVIAEPRLDDDSGTQWYLFASPAEIDTIEYSFLDGSDDVFIETRQGFDVDGVEIKARTDFGAAWIDWRGAYRNAGA